MFLVFALAAVSARAQYVVLIPGFLIAAIVVERGRIVQAGRKLPIIAGAVVLAAVAAVAAGPSLLGRYQAVTSFGVSWDTWRWIAVTLALLTIATGVVVASRGSGMDLFDAREQVTARKPHSPPTCPRSQSASSWPRRS